MHAGGAPVRVDNPGGEERLVNKLWVEKTTIHQYLIRGLEPALSKEPIRSWDKDTRIQPKAKIAINQIYLPVLSLFPLILLCFYFTDKRRGHGEEIKCRFSLGQRRYSSQLHQLASMIFKVKSSSEKN